MYRVPKGNPWVRAQLDISIIFAQKIQPQQYRVDEAAEDGELVSVRGVRYLKLDVNHPQCDYRRSADTVGFPFAFAYG